MIALQPAGQVVPCRRDHRVLPLQILDDLLVRSLDAMSILTSHIFVRKDASNPP